MTPNISRVHYEDLEAPKFGIADGGHTFKVIARTMGKIDEYRLKDR